MTLRRAQFYLETAGFQCFNQALPQAVTGGVEDRLGIARCQMPAAALEFPVELARGPAGIAEKKAHLSVGRFAVERLLEHVAMGAEVDVGSDLVCLTVGVAVSHQHEYPVSAQGTAEKQRVFAGFRFVDIGDRFRQLHIEPAIDNEAETAAGAVLQQQDDGLTELGDVQTALGNQEHAAGRCFVGRVSAGRRYRCRNGESEEAWAASAKQQGCQTDNQ